MKFITLSSAIRHINLAYAAMAVAVIGTCSACSDTKTYAEYLSDESKAVNYFLCDHRVIQSVPADTAFISVQELIDNGLTQEEAEAQAPYYRLTDDGDVYMQVVTPGDRANNKVTNNQQIYFRFMRTNLLYVWEGYSVSASGNAEDMSYTATYFRYNDFTLSGSSQYGQGLQMPLAYLGIDCEVNLVIRSQYGLTSEISDVTPYLYNVRYFPSQI